MVNTVSRAWYPPASRSEVRPGATAASSHLRGSPAGSLIAIDPAFVEEPRGAAGQGDENHGDDGEQVGVVLGIAGEHPLTDEEEQQGDDDPHHGQQRTNEKPTGTPRPRRL